MHTFIKSCFTVAMAGVLLTFANLGMAMMLSKDKDKVDEVVKRCEMECKSNKDHKSYEGCMTKCYETHRSKNPTIQENNKK